MVQLRYFAISPPALIAVPGFEQIRVRELLETTCCVESRGKLVSNRLIIDKTVAMRRADGLFVELLGLENVAFDSRNFRADQCERGSQNSPGSSLPIRQAVCGSRLEPRHAADTEQAARHRRTPHG